MIYKFFNKDIYQPSSYLLLSVLHNEILHCASYYKEDDDEFIISITTGEKFYNLYDFVYSIKGMRIYNENIDCSFYDENSKCWFPISYL